MMRSVQRTLAVFDCFTQQRPSLTLQEISNRVGLPKSTMFRILQSLEESGYLVRLENQEYCLSFRFTKLAGLVQSTLDIRQLARPVMTALAKQVSETVTLNTMSGNHRVCLDVVETSSILRSNTRPGDHVRPVDGATAKVLMAFLPKPQLDVVLRYASKATKRSKADYLEELKRIREQGFSITHGERAVGLTAVSAPISNADEVVKYCLSIAGPTARMKPKIDVYLRALLRSTEDVSRRLGVGGITEALRA